MFRFVLILCLVAFPAALSTGSDLDRSGRIVGGANSAHLTSMATVRSNNYFVCGGVLISNKFVLSSAFSTRNLIPIITTVAFGTSVITSGTWIGVSKIEIHPDFNPKVMESDISLIELATQLTLTTAIQAASLAYTTISEGSTASVYGYGTISTAGSLATYLQVLKAPTIPNAFCKTRFDSKMAIQVRPNHICTLTMDKQGMCFGDSGSPVFIGTNLVAIHSWSVPCGTDTPDVHTRIKPYLGWISNVTGLEFS